MKYFRMSYDEVVFRRSYINLILLNRAIPGIKPFDKRKQDADSSSAASDDDIDNFLMSQM
jgi:hypothetical protein